jgi:hypothetical protein
VTTDCRNEVIPRTIEIEVIVLVVDNRLTSVARYRARPLELLERTFGWLVDVECAWERGTLYLLQCRPITTL